MLKNISLLLLSLAFLLLNSPSAFGTDYIFYLRARGVLGDELRTYWWTVRKDPDISHDAIRDYPPHCSLTGFFPKNESRETYIQAVVDAIQQFENMPRTITIQALIQGGPKSKLDYISLSSSYLLEVTQAFMNNASIPQQFLKNPDDFTYHITLRDHLFKKEVKKKLKKIQSLQQKINISAQVSWSLFLYERNDDGQLSVVEEFPI